MSISPQEFGKRLHEARLKAGLSQDQVAALMGVERSSVSRWENGSRPITFQALQQLAGVLQTTLNELISTSPAPGMSSIAVAASAWDERSDGERQAIAQIVDVLSCRPELLPDVLRLTTGQQTLNGAHPVLSRLSTIDIGQLTPVAALSLLDDLQQQLAGDQ
jgi:transcriptional regulator with XRE-family HTH domain